jgi:thiosulfate/3-mercaptopyruvate sulfurtransferase
VISTAELAALAAQAEPQQSEALRIVDCRASLASAEAGRELYRQGHLPGASFADLLHDLSGPILPGRTGRHPLPPIETFVARVRSWGIGEASQVVVYDDAGGAFAARLWWLLRWLGHESVAVLDGGYPAWIAEGRPVTTQAPILAVGDFSPRARTDWLVQARDLMQSSPRKLFDARAPERFRGDVEPIDPVAGHIPGALSLPFADNLQEGRFRPAAELRERFAAALGGTAPEEAVVYCGSGVTACHDLLAFAHAGLPIPKLYAGSWSEWITDPERPVEKG